MSNVNEIADGTLVKARWFDDPRWYKGIVMHDPDGKAGIMVEQGPRATWGELEGAHECEVLALPAKTDADVLEELIRDNAEN